MIANRRNIVKILLLVLDADSETQVFSSKTQLASHLLQLRAAATKTRLADEVSCSQPPFLQVSFQLLAWVAPGFTLCLNFDHHHDAMTK